MTGADLSEYGELTEPVTLRIERTLPGPIERVWAYLTQSHLRGQWLATGDMELRVGGKVNLTWRNDELTGHREHRPPGFDEVHHQESKVIHIDPPRHLTFGWAGGGDVTFELEPGGDDVKLTVTHRRASERSQLLGVSAGWHTHLDVLVARLNGRPPKPFWTSWTQLRADYDARFS